MSPYQSWTSLAARGFRFLGEDRLSDSLAFWTSASLALAAGENSGSPCTAFVHNNLGVAFLLQSKMEDAKCAFEFALSHWAACRLRLISEAKDPSAASSAHHLRLALQHSKAFSEANRRHLQSLLDAATEITRANLEMASLGMEHRCHINIALIARGLGEHSLAALAARAHMHSNGDAGLATSFANVLDLAADMLARPHTPSFSFALERAADLTLLAHPSLMSSSASGSDLTECGPHLRET